MDFDGLRQFKTALGTGSMTVIDKSQDVIALTARISSFFKHESCGQCTPCREGCMWMYQILQRFTVGNASKGEIDMLEDISRQIEGHTILCARRRGRLAGAGTHPQLPPANRGADRAVQGRGHALSAARAVGQGPGGAHWRRCVRAGASVACIVEDTVLRGGVRSQGCRAGSEEPQRLRLPLPHCLCRTSSQTPPSPLSPPEQREWQYAGASAVMQHSCAARTSPARLPTARGECPCITRARRSPPTRAARRAAAAAPTRRAPRSPSARVDF